jgi:hypothetical protein
VGRDHSDLGSDLLIRVGHPEDVLPELASAGSTVFAEAAVASEETSVEARLKRRLGANAQLNLVWGTRGWAPACMYLSCSVHTRGVT